MELIPKDIQATLPSFAAVDSAPDLVAVVKLFRPFSRYAFFVVGGQREANGDLCLLGFFRSPIGPAYDQFDFVLLSDLERAQEPLGLGIERELDFQPSPISKLLMEIDSPNSSDRAS